jgi:NhaP-type Na+/H+ or K+/H+ antiporter
MNIAVKVLVGLVAGYLVGIALGAFTAFVLDFDSAARFVAIGCALAGAALAPFVLDRFGVTDRT